MSFLIIIFTFILSFSNSHSKDFCKYSTTTKSDEVKYTQQKSINVDDIPNHVIRIFKTETLHKNPKKNCEGLKIVKTDFYGISDYILKSGIVKGYSIATYDDGSKIYSNLDGIAQTPKDQSKNGIVSLNITVTGGTGIYKGVKGFGNGKTEFNPDTGYSKGFTNLNYSISE